MTPGTNALRVTARTADGQERRREFRFRYVRPSDRAKFLEAFQIVASVAPSRSPKGIPEMVPKMNPFGAWKTALRKAGVDHGLRLHDLRHTFASRLVSRGVPIFDVSKLLGHQSITMTMRYAHLAPIAFENAIEQLEK